MDVVHLWAIDFSIFNGKTAIESKTLIFLGFSVDSFQIPISPPYLESSLRNQRAFVVLTFGKLRDFYIPSRVRPQHSATFQ